MTNAEFTELYPKYESDIRAIARKLARRDNDLFEDLSSVGSITFWGLTLAKAETNEAAWVKSAVRKRMIDFMRKERSYSKESLNTLLARGNQVTEGVDGEPSLVRPMTAAVHSPADGETYRSDSYLFIGDDD